MNTHDPGKQTYMGLLLHSLAAQQLGEYLFNILLKAKWGAVDH
jgi:hypothetical protein